jgi:putative alpha-1,2-mannosidase
VHRLHLVARLERPFAASGTWHRDTPTRAAAARSSRASRSRRSAWRARAATSTPTRHGRARSTRCARPPSARGRFVEGSAAQYTWFVPQDVAGLVAALGGRDAALARLDAFFANLNAGAGSANAFLGNEPTLLTPYLYNWLGRPAARASCG